MYTSTPADVPDPPFRFFEGLAPRLLSEVARKEEEKVTNRERLVLIVAFEWLFHSLPPDDKQYWAT